MKQKRTPVQYVISLLFYCAGLFCLAVGVIFSVNAALGISPVSSMPYIISLVSPISLGTCVTAVYGTFVLVQIILLRREFKLISLLQLLCASLFGYFVDLAQLLLGDFAIPTMAGRLSMLFIMLILCGVGLTLYVGADLIPLPTEGLALAVVHVTKASFPKVKTLTDTLYVLISVLLSFLFFHELRGLGLATIVPALLGGKAVAIARVPLLPIVNKCCFGDANKDKDK